MKILVIGQGLAGALATRALQKKGFEVWGAEGTLEGGTASTVAAGIVNPVTGKRYVKSWRFDDFFPFARHLYREMEQEYGISIWHEKPILRLLGSTEEVNDWSARCAQPEYADLLEEGSDAGRWGDLLATGTRFGWIKGAARVDFAPLLRVIREELQAAGRWLPEQVSPSRAEQLCGEFDHLVFCEGHRAINNPYFPDLPWQLAKGEACIIRIEHPAADAIDTMLKKTLTLVPFGNRRFWCGATFEWNYANEETTAAQQQVLMHHLTDMLAVPFTVEKQLAAVRPTNKERRPFLLSSPLNPAVWMLNGLGTKGALLAPWYAEQLANRILNTE